MFLSFCMILNRMQTTERKAQKQDIGEAETTDTQKLLTMTL